MHGVSTAVSVSSSLTRGSKYKDKKGLEMKFFIHNNEGIKLDGLSKFEIRYANLGDNISRHNVVYSDHIRLEYVDGKSKLIHDSNIDDVFKELCNQVNETK